MTVEHAGLVAGEVVPCEVSCARTYDAANNKFTAHEAARRILSCLTNDEN